MYLSLPLYLSVSSVTLSVWSLKSPFLLSFSLRWKLAGAWPTMYQPSDSWGNSAPAKITDLPVQDLLFQVIGALKGLVRNGLQIWRTLGFEFGSLICLEFTPLNFEVDSLIRCQCIFSNRSPATRKHADAMAMSIHNPTYPHCKRAATPQNFDVPTSGSSGRFLLEKFGMLNMHKLCDPVGQLQNWFRASGPELERVGKIGIQVSASPGNKKNCHKKKKGSKMSKWLTTKMTKKQTWPEPKSERGFGSLNCHQYFDCAWILTTNEDEW